MFTKVKLLALIASSMLLAGQAQAGILSQHPDAFDDGNGPFAGAWTGSVGYNVTGQSTTLSGQIDFAVFTAAKFNSLFPGLGYVPGDQLVYTYQLENTGTAFVSAQLVGIQNPAGFIGTFDIGDVNATNPPNPGDGVGPGEFDGTGNALWQFGSAIGQDQSSWGLAFSSPNIPVNGLGLTLDSGLSALSGGLPTPGPTEIPEPSSIFVLLGGYAASLLVLRRRNA